MGNSLGGRKMAKVMKIDGQTFKLKTPVRVEEVIKEYPDHVLIESEMVKHFGIRAKPLKPQQELQPKRLYFLLKLPRLQAEEKKAPRRVRSEIAMSAKDRLESLMFSRRSTSDLSILESKRVVVEEAEGSVSRSTEGGSVRVRVRVPKARMEKFVEESEDATELVEKILGLCDGNHVHL